MAAGVVNTLKNLKDSTMENFSNIANNYPDTCAAILLIGSVGAILGLFMGYTGPSTGDLSGLASRMNAIVPTLLLCALPVGIPAGLIFYFNTNKKDTAYKCAHAVLSLIAIGAAFFIGNLFCKGLGDQALNPMNNSISLGPLKIPIPLPAEMSMAGLTSVVLYGAAGGNWLLTKAVKKNEHRRICRDIIHLVAAISGLAITTFIVLANIHGKSGADQAMILTSPILAQSIAGAGMGVMIFIVGIYKFLNPNDSYQYVGREDRVDGDKRQAQKKKAEARDETKQTEEQRVLDARKEKRRREAEEAAAREKVLAHSP